MALSAGTRLGPYEILAPLGAGGMGEVYRARDPRLEREVAIKVLPAETAGDAERIRRLEREARAASALNHPNIITIHDIGEHEGAFYIAMEYVEGQTLRKILEEGPLSSERMVPLATQIAEALAKAHSAGIVHRDLKPENVMVTSDGLVKVLDFGLAKLQHPTADAGSEMATATKVTRNGAIVGTAQYMSPEQAVGRPVDYRSDQFSLGLILYEMATGEVAFRRDSVPQTQAAIIEDEPEPLPSERVPPHLPAIVGRCLAKNPEDRYDSTRDLARELKSVGGAPSGPSREASAVSPPQPRARRRWPLALSVAGALAALLAIAVGLNLGGLRDRFPGRPFAGPTIQSLAVLPLDNVSKDPEQEYFADGMTEALIADLAKIEAVRVISRQSVMRFKGSDTPLPEIARLLKVDALVEGSILRSGDRVRITAQLVQADPERHLWAESYERDLRDVLSLQGDVSRQIAQEIRATVTPDEEARLSTTRPVDPQAYELYLKGGFLLERFTPEAMEAATAHFQKAIRLDPDFAPAHVGLARSYLQRVGWGDLPFRQANALSRTAAEKALSLDDTVGEAHSILGHVKLHLDWDWKGAETEYKRGIALSPNSAMAHGLYGYFLRVMKRYDEAIEQQERRLSLNPLSPIVLGELAMAYSGGKKSDLALEKAGEAFELDPSFPPGHFVRGYVLLGDERFEEAIGVALKAPALSGRDVRPMSRDVRLMSVLGLAYAATGKKAEALKVIGELEEMPKPGHLAIAAVYAALGRDTKAFEWLERAYAERDPELIFLEHPPYPAPFRSDPRFQDLLRRMNFPP